MDSTKQKRYANLIEKTREISRGNQDFLEQVPLIMAGFDNCSCELYYEDMQLVWSNEIDRDFIVKSVKKAKELVAQNKYPDITYQNDKFFDYAFFRRVLKREYESQDLQNPEKFQLPITDFNTRTLKIYRLALDNLDRALKKDLEQDTGLQHFVYNQRIYHQIFKSSMKAQALSAIFTIALFYFFKKTSLDSKIDALLARLWRKAI